MDLSQHALVIVDLQRRIAALKYAPHSMAEVLERTERLASACRRGGLPVVFVRTVYLDRPDPRGDEIAPQLRTHSDDLLVTKHQWAAFHGTPLDLYLRRRAVHGVLLAGVMTNFAIEGTVRFVRATEDPQARRLSLDARERSRKRRIRINDIDSDVILWRDNAPDVVEANIRTPSGGSMLRVWNNWRDYMEPAIGRDDEIRAADAQPKPTAPVSVTHGGLRRAGIVVEEESAGRVVLRCSDGVGSGARLR